MSLIKNELPIKTLVRMQKEFSRLYSSTEFVSNTSAGVHVTSAGMFELLQRVEGSVPVILPFSRTKRELKLELDGVCFYALVDVKILKERKLI